VKRSITYVDGCSDDGLPLGEQATERGMSQASLRQPPPPEDTLPRAGEQLASQTV
jgi:hypothetical protein